MMNFFFWVLFVLYLFASAVCVFVVLIQSGKGGGLSSLAGAGSTLGDTLGASGIEKTLNRWTTYCAIGFLVITILLVAMGQSVFRQSIVDKVQLTAPTAAPADSGAAASPAATTGGAADATVQAPAAAAATEAPAAEPKAEVPAPAPAEGAPAAPAEPAPAPAGQ